LKVSIFIFILAMFAAGSVVAQENSASSSPTSATAEAVSITDQADQMPEGAIDERIIDRSVSFDLSDRGRSNRYSVSFDLEREASD
jgi:CRP-like cAMP-binding protein